MLAVKTRKETKKLLRPSQQAAPLPVAEVKAAATTAAAAALLLAQLAPCMNAEAS